MYCHMKDHLPEICFCSRENLQSGSYQLQMSMPLCSEALETNSPIQLWLIINCFSSNETTRICRITEIKLLTMQSHRVEQIFLA